MSLPLKYSIIFLSFIVGWVLMILPLPPSIHILKPEWIILLLLFWSFREPMLVGVGIAWGIGLLMDVINGCVLGQYALSMAIVVALAGLFKYRMRVLPMWHQMLVILILVGFGKLSLLMVQWIIGHPPATLWYWFSTLTTMLFWPFMLRIFQFYGNKTL